MDSATGFSGVKTRPRRRASSVQGQPERKPTYDSVEALAVDLGMSRHSTYAALRRGEIPHIRIGKRFVIPRAAVHERLRTAGRQTANV